MASLKLCDINKVYPSGSLALYDVNFEARDKEFLVILGGEKSGKSTLLRVIAGLEEPTSGIVMINGKDAADVPPRDRDMAMVFKGDSLYKALTVYENIAFGLRARRVPNSVVEERVKAVSNILGLNDLLQRKPKVLTAAAKQRVAIGRALAREPSVYLFDEPLSGMDDKLKSEMLNIIVNLQARVQGTFIYATKNLSEAMTIGTRIIVMKSGIIQQIDTPANLYDYPANAYVAFYIGSPSINFIQKAKIVKEGENFFAVFGEGGKFALTEKIVKRFENIEEYAESGNGVILGVRPEDIKICADGEIEGKIGKTEQSGGAVYAEFDFAGQSLIVTASEGASGDGKAAFDLNRLYIFDSVTRLSLLVRDEGYKKTDYPEADVAPMAFTDENAVIENFKPKKDDKRSKLR